MKILKRDGNFSEFEKEKIVDAITKAMVEVTKEKDEDLAWSIAEEIEAEFEESEMIPTVETVQDRVEELLATYGRFDVSRAYIVYRDKKRKKRETGWEMNDLQRDIYEKKYRFESESFDEFLDRVSGDNEFIKKSIRDKKFMPAGRILAGRGLQNFGKKITYSNCYVMPKVEDNIESIFDTAKYLARTYSYGGGVGLTLSKLRPKGARVNNAADTTTGAVSFMALYALVTDIIGMRGRRGALMLNLDCNHPDIEEFIDSKNDLSKITSANISVNINNEFMKAVERGEKFSLYFKVESTGEEILKEVDARELFKKLARNNWNMAEPGMLFSDMINNWHIMSGDEDFEFAGVNPCAEETLPAFGSCNLASINLSEFVKYPFTEIAEFNYEEFGKMVRNGVIYLNEILDENLPLHPLKEQSEVSKNLRQIGLGIMGLADMLIKLGIKYGSEESVDIIDKIGNSMINESLRQSALLAKEDGAFPLYKKESVFKSEFLLFNAREDVLKLIMQYGLRNSQLLTIAPTGSISTLIGCSGGVEPLFQVSYTRKSESLHDEATYYKVFAPIAKEYMEINRDFNEENLPEYFITTTSLEYRERIDVQAAWQKHIDAGISSTVNVPNSFSVEDVEELYFYAWRQGVKGITIYRDGCSRAGILTTSGDKSKMDRIDELTNEINELANESLKENPDICPICGGNTIHTNGCVECLDCGYSPCSI